MAVSAMLTVAAVLAIPVALRLDQLSEPFLAAVEQMG